MRDLIGAIRDCPDSTPTGNGTLIVLCRAWHDIVRPYIDEVEAFREGDEPVFKNRIGDYIRGSRIAFLRHILQQAGREHRIESSKELGWMHARIFARWLQGDNPDHDEATDGQRTQSRRRVAAAVRRFLFEHDEAIGYWETSSRERRQGDLSAG